MIKLASPSILDEFGNPIKQNGKRRAELAEAFAKAESEKAASRRPVRGSYDAIQDGDEFKNYWAPADALDADSANSQPVRAKLVQRSRYEVANNGFAAGIVSTYANDLVGIGPSLRMQTGSEAFNRMVEREWNLWATEIKFHRKLWTQAHAKYVDGEAFGVLRQNRGLQHPVKLDWVLYETEQIQTPYLPYGVAGYIDGIRFDQFGNPIWYDLLKDHPGSNHAVAPSLEADQIPARFVTHWFQLTRPGQHRGVPENASTLNIGAAARRWREATIAAAENIADFSLFIKTMFEPDEIDQVTPMSTVDIQKRMMTALPAGYDAYQPKAEQPTANHGEFHKSLINEQARPKSMPYNKAACDSSNYNFASGRLDHSTYYGSLDVERQDAGGLVLDRLFDVWFEAAIITFGWLGGNPSVLPRMSRVWDWPKHQAADIKSEAQANDTKLKDGTTSLPEIYSNAGKDYEDELIKSAQANGVTVEQQRQINLLLNVPQHAIQQVASLLGLSTPEPAAMAPAAAEGEDDDET